MKTPEEIKKALAMCCDPDNTCMGRGCPYEPDCMEDNLHLIEREALAYITQLEERIDVLMLQIRGDCGTCKHRDEHGICHDCCDAEYGYHPLWEYEGLPELARKENK